MKNELPKLKKEAENIRLSAMEKAAMHAAIFELAKESVRPHKKAVPSPYLYTSIFSFRMSASFAAIVLLVFGSTTAYAAQGALPGEALYAVKTKINEPVASALAVSSEAKASYQADLAERRMEEAEALAATGRLNSESAKMLEAKLAVHTEVAENIARELQEEDPEAAVEVAARLSSTLETHSAILAHLGQGSEDKDTKENSDNLAMYVRSKNATFASRTRSEEAQDSGAATMALKVEPLPTMSLKVGVTSTTTLDSKATGSQEAALQATATSNPEERMQKEAPDNRWLRIKAQSALGEARSAFKGSQKTLDATTVAAIEAKLVRIEEYIEQGKLTFAIEESVRLEALIKANKKFKTTILRDLLWERDAKVEASTTSAEKGVEDTDKGENETEEENPDTQESSGGLPKINVQLGL